MGEVLEGDYLLNGIGMMRYVSSVNRNSGDAFEITSNSKARTFNIHSRQRAIVGAEQKLDVFIDGVHERHEAWHMVMYKLSGDGAIPEDRDYERARTNSERMTEGHSKITISVSVILEAVGEPSPERQNFEDMIKDYSTLQKNVLHYLFGVWVGDGTVRNTTISSDPLDKDYNRIGKCASILGFDCDFEYDQLPEDIRSQLRLSRPGVANVHIPLEGSHRDPERDDRDFDAVYEFISSQQRDAENRRRESGNEHSDHETYRRGAARLCIFEMTSDNTSDNTEGVASDNNSGNTSDNNTDDTSSTRRIITQGTFYKMIEASKLFQDSPPDVNGNKKKVKSAPAWFGVGSVEARENFIAGLIDSDGTRDRNSYKITTIYEDLCHKVVFFSRSLGIHVSVYTPQRRGDNQQTYIIKLSGGAALRRISDRLGIDRKKLARSSYDEAANDPPQVAFAVTPLHEQREFVQIEIEGGEFQLANGLLMLDSKADVTPGNSNSQ